MRKELRDMAREWESVRDGVVDSEFYAKESRAVAYVNGRLAKVWRPWLGFEVDDDPLSEELDLTPTMCLMLHFFARGVLHFGAQSSKAPLLPRDRYMPFVDDSEILRRPRAVCKRDICKIIRRSMSAVEDSIGRLRGKGKYEHIYAARLAFALYVDSGIMLDILTNPQALLSFEVDDYAYAKRLAKNAQLRDAETNEKQRVWSDERSDPNAVDRIRMAVEIEQRAKPASEPAVH